MADVLLLRILNTINYLEGLGFQVSREMLPPPISLPPPNAPELTYKMYLNLV